MLKFKCRFIWVSLVGDSSIGDNAFAWLCADPEVGTLDPDTSGKSQICRFAVCDCGIS